MRAKRNSESLGLDYFCGYGRKCYFCPMLGVTACGLVC